MPIKDTREQLVDSQVSFLGGMECRVELQSPDSYSYGRNIEIRDGTAVTRRTVKLAYPRTGAVLVGFYFNEEAAEVYDPPAHTGFWFPFRFSRTAFGNRVQGCALVKSPEWVDSRFLYVSGGAIILVSAGYVQVIQSVDDLVNDTNLTLLQASGQVFMFRGDGARTLSWDFGPSGFVPVSAPGGAPGGGTWDPCPSARIASYHMGRIWAVVGSDDIAASDVLAPHNWDLEQGVVSAEYGDEDDITCVYPFSDDILIFAKRHSLHYISGVAGAGDLGEITRKRIAKGVGVVGKNAAAHRGGTLYFLSYQGVFKAERNAFGTIDMIEESISAPVQSIIDRISWGYVDSACMGISDNYLLISLPLDGATRNNAMLVYDLYTQKWVGVWDGPQFTAVQFFVQKNDVYFVGWDGSIRQMMCQDMYDSYDPYTDFPTFLAGDVNNPGDIRIFEGSVYKCIKYNLVSAEGSSTHMYYAPGNAEYWEYVDDPWQYVSVYTELVTRAFRFGDKQQDVAISRAELYCSGRDPDMLVWSRSPDPHVRVIHFTGLTYDRTKYTVAGFADWDPSNVNLDFSLPYRQDYTLYIPEDGLYVGEDSPVELNVWTPHTVRFIPRMIPLRGVTVGMSSVRGGILVTGVAVIGMPLAAFIKKV